MSEAATINVQAFQPFDGGGGATLSVTDETSSVFVPGSQANDGAKLRVLITNDGSYSASIRMGQSGVTASLSCMKILPGCAYLLTPPYANPSGLWLAGICATGRTTTLQITPGTGT